MATRKKIIGASRHSKLYQAFLERDLEAALQEIEDAPVALEASMNDSDETLLHVAISHEEWKMANEILTLMIPDQKNDGLQSLLKKPNLNGNTLLHELASKVKSTTAKEQSMEVAKAIVRLCDSLVHIRNAQKEIPLHKAALFGHTALFEYLYSQGSDIRAKSEGGATVLHCAVMGTHFELAEKIVKECRDLRLFRDHQGMTPLHILVLNPTTFESGSKLGPIDSFIYKRILPEEDISLYRGDEDNIHRDHPRGDDDGKKPMVDYVSLFLADEDSTPTRSAIPHPSKKTLDEKIPPNYVTCFNIGRWMHSLCCVIASWRHSSPLFLIANKKYPGFNKIVEQKRMHGQALRLVGSLARESHDQYWTQLSKGRCPVDISSDTHENEILNIKHDGKNGGGLNLNGTVRGQDLPHILAAKMGATNFVQQILTACPMTANLTDDDGKNILQVAVEHRQEKIVRLIKSREKNWRTWRRNTASGMDKKSNTILHSAARIGDTLKNLVPVSAFQMQRELIWFEKVERLVPPELLYHRNFEGETAQELFTSCHAEMVKTSKEQLITTAQACSALVAAVVFATSFSIPGGTDQSGQALFLDKPAFKVFTNAYVVGLSSAATALLLFVSLIIAPYNEQEFRQSLPTKFTLAFVSLFVALACMVVAFSSNIYLTINGKRNAGDIVPLICELTIFPAFAFAVLFCHRASFGFLSTLKDVFFYLFSRTSSKVKQRKKKATTISDKEYLPDGEPNVSY